MTGGFAGWLIAAALFVIIYWLYEKMKNKEQ